MRVYEGICHDGPYAGRAISKDRREFQVAVIPPLTAVTLDCVVPETMEYQTGAYVWSDSLGKWTWKGPEHFKAAKAA